MDEHDFRSILCHYIDGLPYRSRVICVSPFRDETHASFDINFSKCLWYDHGTGKGGSAYDFIMEAEQCSFKDAALIADRILGKVSIEPTRYRYNPGEKTVNSEAFNLAELPVAELTEEDYFTFGNGILTKRGISYEVLLRHRVFVEKSALIIPYEIEADVVKRYKRISYSGGNKEMKTRGGSTLYPLRSLYKSRIVICEGEYDVLSLLSHGINGITGTAGCKTFKQEWAWAMSGKDVTILYDNDDPGRSGSLMVKDLVRPYARRVRVASFPSEYAKGYDISDHFTEGKSVDELRKIIAAGT